MRIWSRWPSSCPGPASSQVGMGVGLLRAGIAGSVRAGPGFTPPSAVLLIGAGVAVGVAPGGCRGGRGAGKVAAAAVVAQAVVQMAPALCVGWARGRSRWRRGGGPRSPDGVDANGGAGGRGGARAGRSCSMPPSEPVVRPPWGTRPRCPAGCRQPPSRRSSPCCSGCRPSPGLAGRVADPLAGFYRAGALVFGGGHVVLPLLEEVVVGAGAVSVTAFLAGYGLANAVPGPLFTFAGYLGAVAGGALLGVGPSWRCSSPGTCSSSRCSGLAPVRGQHPGAQRARGGERRGRRPARGGALRPGVGRGSPGGQSSCLDARPSSH